MKLKSAWEIIKDTANEFSQDRALRLAAATAYYAIFSIGPFLVLIVGLAGLVFGEETVRKEVGQQAQSFLGEKSASLINSMMSAQKKSDTLLATIIGGTALLMGAAGIFGQLQDSLNTIWGVTTKPGKGIWAYVRDRFFSMAMVLGIGFLLLVSMALSAFVNAFAGYIADLVSLPTWVAPGFNHVVSFLVVSTLFALIFKVLPDVKIRWGDVWVGAVGTAFLFTVGQVLLSRYLAYQTSASAYGAGSAVVVILLYIYYASVILYVGAEFTLAYARHHGAKFEPSKYAVHVTDFQRAEEGTPGRKHIEKPVAVVAQPPTDHYPSKPRHIRSPGDVVKAHPWRMVTLAVPAFFALRFVWRFKTLRKALKEVL